MSSNKLSSLFKKSQAHYSSRVSEDAYSTLSSNGSMDTLVDPKLSYAPRKGKSPNSQEAFGALASTYGFGGAYGPPPVNPPGVASKKSKHSALSSSSQAPAQSHSVSATPSSTAFGALTGVYGFSGPLPGPPPSSPTNKGK